MRGQLGAWADDPAAAGELARRIGIEMARVALGAGRDVIVPQVLARPAFVEQLAALAASCGVAFVELALLIDRDHMHEAFARRGADPRAAPNATPPCWQPSSTPSTTGASP